MYQGAGILFLKKINGQIYISLGKRTINPQKGFWSIPGGKMSHSDNRDFLLCAWRETKEEYFHKRPDEFSRISNINYIKESRFTVPFIFEYRTFLVDLSDIDIKFYHNWEFSLVDWFELRNLPEKTHPGVRYSLQMFGL